MSAFVDTSVWFAAAAKRDAQNERAKSILQSIDQHLTTDLVLTETWQRLKAKFGKDVAEKLLGAAARRGSSDRTHCSRRSGCAAKIQASSSEEGFSFVDRTSFAMMERIGITQAATFNPHFAVYRPRRGRKRPFQILSEGHSQVFMVLRQAILQRRPVHVSHGGKRQTVCPYILGHAAGEERAFSLLVEASSSTKRPAQTRWICLRLSKIEDVRFADEPWEEQD
jgi:predicted nucleic acid-binding protein